MTDHPDHARRPGGSHADSVTTDEILAAIAAEEPRGATADHIAIAIGLSLNGEVVQSLLEELVAQGLLTRRGIDHGAVYTLQGGT